MTPQSTEGVINRQGSLEVEKWDSECMCEIRFDLEEEKHNYPERVQTFPPNFPNREGWAKAGFRFHDEDRIKCDYCMIMVYVGNVNIFIQLQLVGYTLIGTNMFPNLSRLTVLFGLEIG